MELIKIVQTKINGSDVNSVNARELHEKLGVKKDFSDWIKAQINSLEFEENIDYLVFQKKGEYTGRPLTEYFVTLDTAKHITMVARSAIGKEVRKYFIEVEKKASLPSLPQNYIEALEALTKSEKEKLSLSSKLKEKDDVILAIADLNIKAGNVSIGDFAKNLAIKGLGQNNIFAWLKGRGFLMMDTTPYQQYVARGYFVRKPFDDLFGGEVRYKTFLTPKGTVWLAKMLKAEFEIE